MKEVYHIGKQDNIVRWRGLNLKGVVWKNVYDNVILVRFILFTFLFCNANIKYNSILQGFCYHFLTDSCKNLKHNCPIQKPYQIKIVIQLKLADAFNNGSILKKFNYRDFIGIGSKAGASRWSRRNLKNGFSLPIEAVIQKLHTTP